MKSAIIQRITLVGSDLLSLLLCLVLAKFALAFIRPGIDNISLQTFGAAKFAGLLLIMIFWYQEHYVKRRPIWEEIRLLFSTIFLFALFHLAFSYFLSHQVVRFLTLLFWGSLLFILPINRYICKLILLKFNLWQRGVYIVGVGENATTTYSLLTNDKILGYRFLGFVDLEPRDHTSHAAKCRTLELNGHSLPIFTIKQLRLTANTVTDYEIVLALNSRQLFDNARIINILQSQYTFVSIVPDISGLPLYGVALEHFFGSEQLFLRLQNNLSRRMNRIIKGVFDIILSVGIIVILSPLLLLISCGIKLTTRDKILFKHKRAGVAGSSFYCLKFQTMYPNSQELLENHLAANMQARLAWEQDFKLKNDPRITPIGKFLRKTSLDELPQLFNVIKGDMSLVGPRPIVAAEIPRYGDDYYYYKLVKPGITGLWQISGRNNIDYATRVRLDVYYAKNWSLWYDFVILFKTTGVVFARTGAY